MQVNTQTVPAAIHASNLSIFCLHLIVNAASCRTFWTFSLELSVTPLQTSQGLDTEILPGTEKADLDSEKQW